MTPARASVAICTWNRAESLRRTLESFVRMDVPPGLPWELLVVNNNSTDATDAAVASFDGRLPVRLLREPRPGKCYAANRAVEAATGDVILWTDDDVEVDPAWMAALVGGFAAQRADFVFGVSRPLWPAGAQAPDWFSPLHNGLFAVLDYGPEPFVVSSGSQPFYGLNFGVARQVLIDLGGFREDLGVVEDMGGMEDIELFRRACAAGKRIAYVPGAIIRHVVPAGRMDKTFHTNRIRAGLPMYYRTLVDQYHAQPWLFGVPRFLFAKALGDLLGYARSVVARDRAARFYYELQMVKFTGLCRQAAVARRARARAQAPSVRGHQA